MPDPIQPALDSSSYLPMEGASAEENSGQVCLAPALPHASASSDATIASGAMSASASPAVISLVTRFTPPTGLHPPVTASLAKAIEHCLWETANAVVSFGSAMISPGELASGVVSGARALIGIGTAARCIERDEAQQVAQGELANQSADCVRDGAIPLLKADHTVVCARP